MLMKVAFQSAIGLDGFIGRLQHFGRLQTQIVFSTPGCRVLFSQLLIDQADVTRFAV